MWHKEERYGTRMKIASFSDKPRFDVYHRALDALGGFKHRIERIKVAQLWRKKSTHGSRMPL